MDDAALTNYVRSAQRNRAMREHAKALNAGVKPETLGLSARSEGWVVVGWFFAGMRSAWVQAHKIRGQYPNLETKVFDVSVEPCDWQAELAVKLKPSDLGETT